MVNVTVSAAMRTSVASFPGSKLVPGGDSGGATSAWAVLGGKEEIRSKENTQKMMDFFIILTSMFFYLSDFFCKAGLQPANI
jgi:hypothetical protein